MNAVRQLPQFGQSPWLDFIRRSFVRDGSLQKLIEHDGVRGVTSNPAIFEQAIAQSSDYDDAIRAYAEQGLSSLEIYDLLSIEDVGEAADLFRGVYEETNGLDGYVSLEVSPLLAHDTEGTIRDARRLWKELNRPNVMIKVPATEAGVPAIETLLSEGININVTLLFSLERYAAVADAYVQAIRTREQNHQDLHVASVASFFVSRMDSLVDPRLEADANPDAKSLVGEVAVANSRAAYGIFQEKFSGEDWERLVLQGAVPQRLLWASTSTKNKAYPKVKYVDALVGPTTVNTMPLQTIEDYRADGDPANRLTDLVGPAREQLAQLERLGYSLTDLANELETDAVKKFVDPFNALLESIEAKRAQVTA